MSPDNPTPQSKEPTTLTPFKQFIKAWYASDDPKVYSKVPSPRDCFDAGFVAGQESMKAAALTPEENGWVPFGTVWPEKNRLVLVWLDGLNMPFVAYRHDKAGDKNSPQFITPLFNSEEWGFKRPAITHWCDGLTSLARLSPNGE